MIVFSRSNDLGMEMEALNRHLDKLVRPEVHMLRGARPAFQVCGYTGLALAVILTLILAPYLGLSHLVMALLVLSAVLTFFGLVMTTKIITGEERIIYYHHEIAVVVVAAFLLWLLGRPILPYLDVLILGVGAFLVCGRVGCLMVGCCHGGPHRWGVCYRKEHADAGFTPYFVGVRLFPIQAVESLWVLCIVTTGVTFVLNGRPAGAALAWYVVTYDLGRFCFEFLRGDPNRSYLWGFSQPQWISLLLMCGVVWAEMAGVLPFHSWHVVATACLGLAMIALGLARRFSRTARHRLLHPRHVREVAEAMSLISSPSTETKPAGQWTVLPRNNSVPIRVSCTSLGVQISGGKVGGAAGDSYHYTLSCRGGGMTEGMARILAGLILQLRRATGAGALVKGNRDVFHLLINPVTGRESVHGWALNGRSSEVTQSLGRKPAAS
jgi:prolipoprotein diacylglyceryl transferase